jgi:hypothetical protein
VKATAVNTLETKLRKNWGNLSGTPKDNYIIGIFLVIIIILLFYILYFMYSFQKINMQKGFEGAGVVEAFGPRHTVQSR